MRILCPITDSPERTPGHQLFGSSYFREVARETYGIDVETEYLRYTQKGYGLLQTLTLNITLALRIILRKHDILYFRIDPDPLLLLSVLKALGIYRKPIYAWKYTAVETTGNPLKDKIKRFVHRGFTKIFMVTESHVAQSIRAGIVLPRQLSYKRWGEDFRYVDRFVCQKSESFTFISTGKAHRDMETLCEAFSICQKTVPEARLRIFTVRRWGNYDYSIYLNNISNPNIEVVYSDEIKLEGCCRSILDQLFLEMHRCHCALSICHTVKFGVGYTQVLDSLASSLPIISTANPANPIDIDSEGCGITVAASDADSLAEAMIRLATQPELAKSMGEAGRKLTESRYNIIETAKSVLKDICFIC